MRIVFFGSDDFAAVCFKKLLDSPHEIVGVVTNPDVRQGRGMKLTFSVIKEMALNYSLPCLQPNSLKEDYIIKQLTDFDADIFIVVAYGKLLPQAVLDIPQKFCLNIHGSLLPQYRGPAPVHWAILNGDRETGVTVQKMVLALDAGDIFDQERVEIQLEETSGQLRSRMAHVGARLLIRVLEHIESDKYTLISQDTDKVSYAPKLTKDMGKIQWEKPAQTINYQIRGLQPWPGAFTQYKGKLLKIIEAHIVHKVQGIAGTIMNTSKDGFVVACGQDGLLVKKVHLEASKPASAYDFLQGHRLQIGDHLA